MTMTKQVILTGLRANNNLTLGNYFGGMLPLIDMAKNKSAEFQVNLMVADLHSFTTPIDHSKLHEQIHHNLKVFVAAGLPLNNDDVRLFRQSYIPAHSELTWILDCFTGVGEMGRMVEYKDKSAKVGQDRTSVGLFNYPVLMACDVLLYGAKYVPVGDDQRQHLEYIRDIADRMNTRFGDLFVVPEMVSKQHEFFGKDQGLRIKDLQDPTKKMSKSDESGKGVIYLGDNPDVAAKKVMGATTDDKAYIRLDREGQPGISNLLEMLALLRGQSLDEVVSEFEAQTKYGEFKAVVADEVKSFLTAFQQQLQSVDTDAVLDKLATSEEAMNKQANATLLKVQQAVGLRSSK